PSMMWNSYTSPSSDTVQVSAMYGPSSPVSGSRSSRRSVMFVTYALSCQVPLDCSCVLLDSSASRYTSVPPAFSELPPEAAGADAAHAVIDMPAARVAAMTKEIRRDATFMGSSEEVGGRDWGYASRSAGGAARVFHRASSCVVT